MPRPLREVPCRSMGGAPLFLGLGLVFVTASIIALVYDRWSWRQLAGSTSWPSCVGVVTRSDARENVGEGGSSWVFILRYRYVVDGRVYEGRELSFDGMVWSTDPADIERMIRHYPEGTQVRVYYDPNRPKQAALTRGAARDRTLAGFSAALLAFGFLFVVLGAFGLR